MPSVYSTNLADLCGHTRYRAGCWSCRADSTTREVEEAQAQLKRFELEARGYEDELKQIGELQHDLRESALDKLYVAKRDCAVWGTRRAGMTELLEIAEKLVRSLCDSTEPDQLAKAFEAEAIAGEEALEKIWKEADLTKDGELLKFLEDDPSVRPAFAALDRTSIPSTADSLVSMGLGFQVFLKNTLGARKPVDALGEKPGPAVMSYGSALAMFGSADIRPSRKVATDETLEAAMGNAVLDDPSTELQHRLQFDAASLTEPIQKEDQQWGLFKRGRFMEHVALLARHYVRLVAMRERAEAEERAAEVREKAAKRREEDAAKLLAEAAGDPDEKKATPTPTEPRTSSAVPKRTTTDDGWPVVEDVDWVGYTNWVRRCTITDKHLATKTLPVWKKQRQGVLASRVDRIKAWTPPQGWNTISASQPHPSTWNPQNINIDALDFKKFGSKEKGQK